MLSRDADHLSASQVLRSVCNEPMLVFILFSALMNFPSLSFQHFVPFSPADAARLVRLSVGHIVRPNALCCSPFRCPFHVVRTVGVPAVFTL